MSANYKSKIPELFIFNDNNLDYARGFSHKIYPVESDEIGKFIALIAFVTLLGICSFHCRTFVLMQYASESVNALVVDAYREASRWGDGLDSELFYLTYTFTSPLRRIHGQTTVTKSVRVSEPLYMRYKDASTVPVVYCHDAPYITDIVGNSQAGTYFLLSAIGVVGMGSVSLNIFRNMMILNRLSNYGQLRGGRIIDWDTSYDSRSFFGSPKHSAFWRVRATYEFMTSDGQTLRHHKTFTTTNAEKCQSQTDKAVLIVYLNDKISTLL